MSRNRKLLLDDEPYEDEEFDYEEEWDEDEEEGGGPDDLEVSGPLFSPVFTGLLNASGEPILRHPVAVRCGFHPERNKYYTPTMEDDGIPGSEAVVGWVYDV